METGHRNPIRLILSRTKNIISAQTIAQKKERTNERKNKLSYFRAKAHLMPLEWSADEGVVNE